MKFTLRGTGLRRYTRKRLRHDRDAARAHILHLESVIRERDIAVIERDERIARMQADAVDVGVERQLRAAAEQWASEVQVKYLALKAVSDNEHAITLPPMYRDIDSEETATQPIPVLSLAAALNPSAA